MVEEFEGEWQGTVEEEEDLPRIEVEGILSNWEELEGTIEDRQHNGWSLIDITYGPWLDDTPGKIALTFGKKENPSEDMIKQMAQAIAEGAIIAAKQAQDPTKETDTTID